MGSDGLPGGVPEDLGPIAQSIGPPTRLRLMPMSAVRAGSASICSRRSGAAKLSILRSADFFMGRSSSSVLVLVNRVFSRTRGSCRLNRTGPVRRGSPPPAGWRVSPGRWFRTGPVAGPLLEVADSVEEFDTALVDRAGDGAGVAQRSEGDVRQVVFVGFAQPHRLVILVGRGRLRHRAPWCGPCCRPRRRPG